MPDIFENGTIESLQTQQARFAQALNLHRQGRLDAAIAIYQDLANRFSSWPLLQYNLGVALFQSHQYAAALAAFQETVKNDADFFEAWYSGGNCFRILGDFDQAIHWYQRAISANPEFVDAIYNLANLSKEIGAFNKAIKFYKSAIALKSDFPSAWNNLGTAWLQIGCLDNAENAFRKALCLAPDFIDAKYNLSLVNKRQGNIDAAIHQCRQILELDGQNPNALSLLISLLQQTFQWQLLADYESKLDKVTARQLADGKRPAESPFLSFSRSPDPSRNLAVARAWSLHVIGSACPQRRTFASTFRKHGDRSGKIAIGYLSEQFRNAATGHLTAGLFGRHDRERFKVIAYSIGKDDQSVYRQRIERGVDLFRDISQLSIHEAAAQIQEDRVDILVDLIGWMHGHRVGILAQRPAPVQVNYLGYPGTMGSDFHDYIIADNYTIPVEHYDYYSEKIVRMPHTYQVTDDHPPMGDTIPSRRACGLPEKGVVFCSFNTDYKIDKPVFSAWMDIMKEVQGSILWLLVRAPSARRHLLEQVVCHGISADRIVFADALSKERHLSRLTLADIALDTWRVNGHTTTSDALWAGVPVVARMGRHFASRVSAGLLSAIGLDDLVTYDGTAYRRLAISLGKAPERLASVKTRLTANRKSNPLFRTGLFVRHLEQAYMKMWQSYLMGDKPDNITVSDS